MPSSKKLGSNDAQIIKSLKADNASRKRFMEKAAKEGVKLTGSRYSGDGPPKFTTAERGAISRMVKAEQKAKTGPRGAQGNKTSGTGPKGPSKGSSGPKGPQKSSSSSSSSKSKAMSAAKSYASLQFNPLGVTGKIAKAPIDAARKMTGTSKKSSPSASSARIGPRGPMASKTGPKGPRGGKK